MDEDITRLIERLKFLKKHQTRSITLDVDWLLNTLTQTPRPRVVRVWEVHNKLDVDGGDFRDD